MNMREFHEKKNYRYPPLIFSKPLDNHLLDGPKKMIQKHDFYNRKMSTETNTNKLKHINTSQENSNTKRYESDSRKLRERIKEVSDQGNTASYYSL